MEWSTDPKMLEGRAFFKLGETVYDHKRKVLIVGIISCLMLGSLISLGANWAESWGEGDLESVELETFKTAHLRLKKKVLNILPY